MNRVLIALAVAVALVLPAAAATRTQTAVVTISDFAFSPKVLRITAGQTVRFVNHDSEAHTVTAATPATFDSGGLDTGDSWTHTFPTPGTYSYFCSLHPYMKGTIVVRAMK